MVSNSDTPAKWSLYFFKNTQTRTEGYSEARQFGKELIEFITHTCTHIYFKASRVKWRLASFGMHVKVQNFFNVERKEKKRKIF